MPKVFLTGEKDPIVVSESDAQRILSQKNDATFKGTISVGRRDISKRQIKEVSFADAERRPALDLRNPMDRSKVYEFERMLEEYKATTQLDRDISYYGWPVKKLDGIVINPVLGGVHWSVVHYALTNHIVSRVDVPYVCWAIVPKIDGERTDVSAFWDFRRKVDALSDLRSRRNYAQDKAEAQRASIMASVEEFSNNTEFPPSDYDPTL